MVAVGRLIRLFVQSALLAEDRTGAAPLSGGQGGDGAKTRIRDAAVSHYATVGFGRPGLDEIAHAAGVTTNEIVELFGSEEELRQACDDYVLQALVGWAREKATLEGMGEVKRSYQADPGSYQAQISYRGRVVAENTPAAARFIDVLTDESETIIRAGISDGTMRPSDDPRALAVLTATMVVGLITMGPHIERTLGLPASQQQMLLRLALPALELYTHGLYTHGLYTNDSYLRLVRNAVSALQPEHTEQDPPG